MAPKQRPSPPFSLTHCLSRLRQLPPLPTLAALLIVGIWLYSMPTQITAVNDPLPDPTGAFSGILQLMDDSGEFVVAWRTWGITHPPGYPLLSLLANIGTRLLDPFTLYPAVAANLLSFFCAVAALYLLTRPLQALDPSGTAVAAAILLPSFGTLVWLYAVVAEAYAFGLLLAFAMLWLALQLGQRPSAYLLNALGLLFGLAIGHHRTLLFLGPALLLAAWPARHLGWWPWLRAALIGLLSLLIYLYLPIVTLAGSPWVYGRSPATWQGFTDAFLSREYSARLLPPLNIPEILAALHGRLRYLAQEMNPFALSLSLLAILPGLYQPSSRRLTAVLTLAFCGYWLAPVSQSLLIRSYMMILVASLTLAAIWGVGLIALGKWQRGFPLLGCLLSLGSAAYNIHQQHDYIWFHTKDSSASQLIADIAAIPEPSPVVGGVWGPRFFPLAYGKWVSRELAGMQLFDLRADLAGLLQPPPDLLFMEQDLLYAIPPASWQAAYGRAVALSSQGQRLVAIRRHPLIEPQASHPLAANDEIQLISATAVADADQVWLQLGWQARQPISQDYSVFVHVTDQEAIAGPDDLIAQGDRTHPVAGFYPTTSWQTGELVQDNYVIPLPDGRVARNLFLGLYTVADDGRFINHLTYQLQLQPTQAD